MSSLFGVSTKLPLKFSQIHNKQVRISKYFELVQVFKPARSEYSIGNLAVRVGPHHVGSSFSCVVRVWFSKLSWT